MSKFAKGNNKKKTGYLLIILYKLTKFEASSCYSLCNFLITKVHYDPLKGHHSTKGDFPDLKKVRVRYFLMLSPHMKFQNHILNFERTDGRTHGQAKSILPLNNFKVGGIMMMMSLNNGIELQYDY